MSNQAKHRDPVDYEKLERRCEAMKKFPRPQQGQLERIAQKLHFLSIVAPTEALCDEASGGLGYILEDIGNEIASIADDCAEEFEKRMDDTETRA